jgi:glycosyltransferase involved in cell wall biosynthesis
MDSSPFVSVIIPVYNAEATVRESLASVFAQSYPSRQYEVIVIDDGSTDGSSNIIKQFHARLIEQANAGAASARNAGIKNARGELIIFLDSDCRVNPGWIDLHVREHIKNQAAGCIGGAFTIPDLKTTAFFELCDYYSSWYEQNPKCPPDSDYEYLPSTNISFKKSVLETIGGFCAILKTGEDVEICQRIRKEGRQVLFRPHIQVYHFGRNSFIGFLKHHYRWGRHVPLVRRRGTGLRFNFLFRPNPLWPICLFLPIAFGYAIYIAYKWFRFKPVVITIFFPMVLIAKFAYAAGILKGTLDLRAADSCAVS